MHSEVFRILKCIYLHYIFLPVSNGLRKKYETYCIHVSREAMINFSDCYDLSYVNNFVNYSEISYLFNEK